ncbi:amidohydrolase family protein [Herbiconiux sp. 11R-BC]|uniref:amidohydrolase n=1 Tax=Herbiconiux sp. 11R-BC TaxID=3111637 RepID=UPI003C113A39
MDPIQPTTSRLPRIVAGQIITLDDEQPRAGALAFAGSRIVAVGSLDEVTAQLPAGTPVRQASGVLVPGFIDSHFYLQRGGVKVMDLFPEGPVDLAAFQRRMAETALDPDWPEGEPSDAVRREGLRRIQPLLHALGITGIADPWATADAVRVYQQARAAGELSLRITAMPYFEGLRDHLISPEDVIARVGGLGVGSGFGDSRLAFGAMKVYADGEGKRQQALREEPWPGTGERGIQTIAAAELELVARFCAEQGWALGVHAIGPAAMRLALDAFERVNADVPIHGLRFRLIHAYLEPSAETVARAARLGVLVSSQPAIQWQNGAWLRETLCEAAENANPLRSWIDGGVRVALGSDGPYFPFDPLRLLWFVRTRAARGIEGPLGAAQSLTPEQALRGLTRDAAFAAFADHERGVLAPGMLADWAELSVDPLRCSDDELAGASVQRTVVGGRTVFEA